MAVIQQRADVVDRQQAHEQVGEGQDAQHAGSLAEHMDDPVAAHRENHDHRGEDQDAGGVADMRQLADGLAGEHRPRRVETDVHDAYQHQRDHRAEHAELHATGDHLRQAELRSLGAVQRHHRAAEDLPDQQADQRPEHIAAKHHGQRTGDDGGDLQVGTEPQGELAEQAAMPLSFGDVIDRTGFDQGLASH
ncbi:hypothetical protein D3C81_1135040 [compost metagenome]